MTKERQELVKDNIQLAHFVANRYRSMSLEFDDIRSSAYLGLVKAASNFDDGKGTTFATFAVTVITNEILMYARRQKKHNRVTASLDAPLISDEDISLMDVIPSTKDPYGVVELERDISRQIDCLNDTERKLLLVKLGRPDITQNELSEIIGITQSMVSRKMKTIRRKLVN